MNEKSQGSPFSSRLIIRIVLGLAIVGLVPLAFVAFRLVDLNRDALITQVLKTHNMVAETTSDRVSSYLAGWDTVGRSVTEYDDPQSPESIGALQNLLASRDDLVAAVVVSTDNGEILRAQRREFAEVVNELLKNVSDNPTVVQVEDQTWLLLTHRYQGIAANLRLVVLASELERAMHPIQFPDDARIFLVDRSKQLVLGTEEEVSRVPVPMLEAAVSAPVLGSGRYDVGEATIIGAFAPVAGTEWRVLSMQPSSVAEEVAISTRRRALLTVGISVALVLLIAAVAYTAVATVNRALDQAYDTIRRQKERMQDELNVGREIQMSMIPVVFPNRDEFSIHAALVPAREVGGDLYDFFPVDSKRFCFLVGDVSGKGVPAALFMAVTKTLIKATAATETSTAQILARVNDELSDSNEKSMFVTLFVCILDIETGEVLYTNAGHNPPFVKRAEGSLERLGDRHGPIAGAAAGVPYRESITRLQQGDLMVLYTDGVVEAMNASRDLYSEERLMSLLERSSDSVETLVAQIIRDVALHERGTEQSDDVTVLALRYQGRTSDLATT